MREHYETCPRRDKPLELLTIEKAEAAVIDCEVTP